MKILKPFHEATEIVSGEKYVSGSEALALIKNLNYAIDLLDVRMPISKHFKKILIDGFNRRFKRIEYITIIATAALLDPRYKKIYFSDNVAWSIIINSITQQLNEKMCEPELITQSNIDENVSPNVNQEARRESEDKTKIWSFDDELQNKLKQQAKETLAQPRSEMPELTPEHFQQLLFLK